MSPKESKERREYVLYFLLFSSLKNVLHYAYAVKKKYSHTCVCNKTTAKNPLERHRMTRKKNETKAAAVAIVFLSTILRPLGREKKKYSTILSSSHHIKFYLLP